MQPSLEKGAILDQRYEITGILGSGSFGVVYAARSVTAAAAAAARVICGDAAAADAAEVAIKEMPMQSITDCERQADVRAALRHPTIPRVLGYFSTDQHAYLVMDLVAGWDLETVMLKQKGFLAEDDVLFWAVQLCSFLDYLHNHPLYPMVFRDMKPNNVMVDRRNRLHVVDFGLARVFPPGFLQQPPAALGYLWKGMALGTEGYSPPEQYEGFARPQSDIYALGATLHHLVTRRDPRSSPPFSFEKYPPRALNPAVSPGLEAVILRAVSIDINRRYASAREMRAALEAVKRGVGPA